jgi:hypothetical protein
MNEPIPGSLVVPILTEIFTSDNGDYVMYTSILQPVPVVGPVTVPFIVEETVPDGGQLNTCQRAAVGPQA